MNNLQVAKTIDYEANKKDSNALNKEIDKMFDNKETGMSLVKYDKNNASIGAVIYLN